MLDVAVLASGSQGNCTAVRAGDRLLLFDAGLSPRATRQRLFMSLGATLDEVTDLVITHFDADHFRDGWNSVLSRRPLPVRTHRAHVREALANRLPAHCLEPLETAVEIGDGISIEPIRVPHDDRGTTAFVLERRDGEGRSARLGLATDLGRVPPALMSAFRDLDLLAIESNYDPAMQLASDRPLALKERIMGGRGHLSNGESVEAVLAIAAASPLEAIVLLHLSQQCNCPRLVARLWSERAPQLSGRLVISSQFEPRGPLRVAGRHRRAACVAPASLFG